MKIWVCSENCLLTEGSGQEILPYIEVSDNFTPSKRLTPYIINNFNIAEAWCKQVSNERKRFLTDDEIREWHYHGTRIEATKGKGYGLQGFTLSEADIWRITPPFSKNATNKPKTLYERGLANNNG